MEQTFEQEVQDAAKEANLPEVEEAMTPEEEAIPEVKEEPKAEEKKPPETVPLAVHIRQREKHDRELANVRQQFAALQQQVEIGNQRLQQLTAIPEPPAPDPNTDILGSLAYQQQQLQKNVGEVKESLERQKQEQIVRQQREMLYNTVKSDEEVFSQDHPDYREAVSYAKGTMYNEYLALGLTEQQAQAKLQQDAYALAVHAMQTGQSPSEIAYKIAMARGYRRKEAAEEPVQQEPNVVEMRQAGAARSKGAGSGDGAAKPLTFAELAAMDNEEFTKLTSGKNWKKLAGG